MDRSWPRPGGVRARGSALVGRGRELAAVDERLAAAARGEGGVVLISGEPGIGKSRLLLEIQARAEPAGWLALAGRAYDTEGMPPYLPFADAISQYLHSAPDAAAGSRLVEAAREVALLVPELRARLTGAVAPPSIGKEADRYRLFEAVSDFFLGLGATSEAKGLLLCLDDLHWADRSTLLLFQHLSRRLAGARILVVATYRTAQVEPSGPLFEVLAELARGQQETRLILDRLSAEETSALVAGLAGAIPAGEVVQAIHERTEGNPFFVQEVVRHLQGQPAGLAGAGSSSADWSLSEGVRQVIGRRLSRLSTPTQKLLESAAVIGDGLDIALLRAVADNDVTIAHALEEATQAGLLREQESAYVFGHALVRQAIYEGMSLPRRQELHLRAAEAIEAVHAAAIDRHFSALASHYHLAADQAKTADYATRAADWAASVYAFDEALRLYDLAIEALADTRSDEARAELEIKRSEVLLALGRPVDAGAALRAAADRLNGESRFHAILLFSRSTTFGHPNLPLARSAADEAGELARGLGRADLEAAAVAYHAQADWVEGAVKESLAGYEKAYVLSEDLSAVRRHAPFANFPVILYWTGQVERAIEVGRTELQAARAQHAGTAHIAMASNLGLALTAGGLYDEALSAFAEGREIARVYAAPGMRQVLSRCIGMSVGSRMEVFDFDNAETLAEEARDLARSFNFMLPVVSEGIDLVSIYTQRGELAHAATLLSELREHAKHGYGAHGAIWPMRLADVEARLALARNDWPEGLRLAGETLERSRLLARPKYEVRALTSRGKALIGLGRKKEAVSELRQAVEVARPVGDPAMFLRAAAALLAVDGDAALAADARAAIEKMLENLSDVDMRRAFEAAEPVQLVYALIGSGGRPARLQPLYPSGLTEREVEVLRLVARAAATERSRSSSWSASERWSATSPTSTARSAPAAKPMPPPTPCATP